MAKTERTDRTNNRNTTTQHKQKHNNNKHTTTTTPTNKRNKQDISDDVKFAWKIQRDMAERGHSLDSIKKSIEARKPDFDAYIDPQKKHADMVIEVLPTQLVPNDDTGKFLRVRLIQKEGSKLYDPVYLFDEGSTVSWIPCGRKLTW